jgi:hypothetical protein
MFARDEHTGVAFYVHLYRPFYGGRHPVCKLREILSRSGDSGGSCGGHAARASLRYMSILPKILRSE